MTSPAAETSAVTPRRVLIAVVAVAVLAAGVLAWRWYDDPSRRAEVARDDLADLPGVTEVHDRGDVPEVVLAEDATAEQLATVLDEAGAYSDAVRAADGPGFVAVRRGVAVAHVGSGLDPIDPSLLIATGAWPTLDGVDRLLLTHGADGDTLHLSAPVPAVTALAWLTDRTASLDGEVSSTVGGLVATNEESGATARLAPSATGDLPAITPLIDTLARLADLDPDVVVTDPGLGWIEVASAPDRKRARRALRAFPDVRVQVGGG